jgi:hypothetical protein
MKAVCDGKLMPSYVNYLIATAPSFRRWIFLGLASIAVAVATLFFPSLTRKREKTKISEN